MLRLGRCHLILLLWVFVVEIYGLFGGSPTISCGDLPMFLVHWNESNNIAEPVFHCNISSDSTFVITSGNTDNMLYAQTQHDVGFAHFSRVPFYENYKTFTLKVAAQGNEGQTTPWPGQIIIVIDDSDLHYPIFSPLSLQVSIKENTWDNAIGNFTVTDGDGSDEFGIKSVIFTFAPPTGDYGGIFNESAVLFENYASVVVGLKEQLDYETTVFYDVVLNAMDGGGLSTDVNIIVNVIDQEDTPPEFTKIAPFTAVYEDVAINTSVLQVVAIDGDRGINHPIRYAIEEGDENEDFSIDDASGEVFVQHTLDADSKTRTSLYNLNISATEQEVVNKSAPYISYTTCLISVLDVDDNPPVFSYDAYNSSIDELSAVGTQTIFKSGHTITITDADQMRANAAFNVSLTDHMGIFAIDPLKGEKQETFSIVVVDPTMLNCDIVQYVSLTVEVTDKNVPAFFNTASVLVTVKDVNNHWPEFAETNHTIEINETTLAGTPILKVTAVDKDLDVNYNKVYYRMENGSVAFSVDVISGVIAVGAGVVLDRDSVPSYTLVVTADDGTVHPDASSNDTCTVLVVLLDVDNKPPQFDDGGAFVTSIEEDTQNEGRPFYCVNATDPDLDSLLEYDIVYNASVAYDNNDKVISNYPLEPLLVVDRHSGCFLLVQPLDREVTKTIVLAITVTDVHTVVGVDHASGHVTINVIDVNDNPPVFEVSPLFGFIKENMADALISSANDTGVLKVHATDADAVYNVVSLKLISNDRAPNYTVTVDSDSGFLTVGDIGFDYEEFHSVNLEIEALDNGIDPQLTANVSVIISVIDQNDNPPQFQRSTYTFYLPENNLTFANESSVLATDRDSGVYGQVTYLIRDPTCLYYFNISETQGVAVVHRPVDYEQIQQIQGTVFAYDNFYSKDGSPINSDKTEVIIKIIDENDNWPQFLNEKDVIKTAEDVNILTPIGSVEAVDHDRSPQYSTLRFTKLKDSLFKIDEKSGLLSVASSLIDRVGSHNVFVEVCDTGEPPNGPNCNETYYDIDVADVNNHPPEIDFPMEGWSTILKEDPHAYDPVIYVNITDQDTDIENKKSEFNLTATCTLGPTAGREDDRFLIETDIVSYLSAEVYFQGNLSRESCYVYLVCVMATNVNNPAMQSKTRCGSVHVQSMYHHPPQFPPGAVFQMNYTEEQPPGEPVFWPATPYSPDDEGTGNSTAVYCFILGGPYADDFVITDHTYCNFTTAKVLDRESIPAFDDMHVILVATENDVQPPRNDHYDKNNASQLLAHVRVIDINDNPPHFNQSMFFGGVSSDTVKGTNIMNLTAYDVDTIDEGKLRYTIIGTPTFHDKGSTGGLSMDPFTLNDVTGFIYLDYKFSVDQRGYVDFTVQVVDSNINHTDEAHVNVYVVGISEKLVCLADVSPDIFISDYSESFAEEFSSVIDERVVLDVVEIHVDETGQKLNSLSDVYIHLVDSKTNYVIDGQTASNIIDANVGALSSLYDKYHILRVTAPQSTKEDVDLKFYITIGIAAALCCILALTVSVCVYQEFKLKRQLKAATVVAFGSQQSDLNRTALPNTNKHAAEGSNPVWNSSNVWSDTGVKVLEDMSDGSENSLEEVDDLNEFSGGENNPTFERRIETVFENSNIYGDHNDHDSGSGMSISGISISGISIEDNDNFFFGPKTDV